MWYTVTKISCLTLSEHKGFMVNIHGPLLDEFDFFSLSSFE
jgi:hypothetical protein